MSSFNLLRRLVPRRRAEIYRQIELLTRRRYEKMDCLVRGDAPFPSVAQEAP